MNRRKAITTIAVGMVGTIATLILKPRQTETQLNIGDIQKKTIQITSPTTITSFGDAPRGRYRYLEFNAPITLKHSEASLLLPPKADIMAAKGDSCIIESIGNGKWLVRNYEFAGSTNDLKKVLNNLVSNPL